MPRYTASYHLPTLLKRQTTRSTASVGTVIMLDRETLIQRICDVVKKDVGNAILCELPILAYIQHFLTSLDKFSKFSIVQIIAFRTTTDIKISLFQLMNFYRRMKTIYCANEPSIKSETFKSLLSNQFNVQIMNAQTDR